MKKIILIALAAMLCSASACSQARNIDPAALATKPTANTQSQSTTAQAFTEELTTAAPTTEEVTIAESTTAEPTEPPQTAAKQAYLEYLQEHYSWFNNGNTDYQSIAKKGQIAFKDLNGDGVDEMVHIRPGDGDKKYEVQLCILTYEAGTKTLYDDFLFSIPGAEGVYSVFVGSESKLYSVMSKELNGSVTRFDFDGSSFSYEKLADSTAHHLAEPEEAVCHVEGSTVTFEEFHSYRTSVEDKAETYLLLTYQNNKGIDNISMTYEEALNYLQ